MPAGRCSSGVKSSPSSRSPLGEAPQHNFDTGGLPAQRGVPSPLHIGDTQEQAAKFLERWRKCVKRSEIKPLIRFANLIQNHRPRVLNGLPSGQRHSSGAVDGRNRKAKLTLRKAFSFRSCQSTPTSSPSTTPSATCPNPRRPTDSADDPPNYLSQASADPIGLSSI